MRAGAQEQHPCVLGVGAGERVSRPRKVCCSCPCKGNSGGMAWEALAWLTGSAHTARQGTGGTGQPHGPPSLRLLEDLRSEGLTRTAAKALNSTHGGS